MLIDTAMSSWTWDDLTRTDRRVSIVRAAADTIALGDLAAIPFVV